MKVLYILLIIITQATQKPVNVNQPEGVTIMWPVTIQQGDKATPGVSHYQAALFETRDALDLFLEKNGVGDGAILFDLEDGKQYKVKQNRVTKKVNVIKEEFEKFEVELEEQEKEE